MNVRKSPVNELLNDNFNSLINTENECTYEHARNKIRIWRAMGFYAVATAGAYDVLGVNHIRGLVQCRILGAMDLLGINEIKHGTKEALEVYRIAASDKIKLFVSIDTNLAISENKSRVAEKGNSIKPILDWQTRAMMVANQSMPIPNSSYRRNAVDYITKHGPEACLKCDSGTCVHEDNNFSISLLGPNLTVVKSGTATEKLLNNHPELNIAVINESDGAYIDSLLEDSISTTSMIKRIRS